MQQSSSLLHPRNHRSLCAVLCELCVLWVLSLLGCVCCALWAVFTVLCLLCMLWVLHCVSCVCGALMNVLCCSHVTNTSYYLLSDMTESKQRHPNLGMVRENSKGKMVGAAHPGTRHDCHRLQPPAPSHSPAAGCIISQRACLFVYLKRMSPVYRWSYHNDYFSWHQQPQEISATQLYNHTNKAKVNIRELAYNYTCKIWQKWSQNERLWLLFHSLSYFRIQAPRKLNFPVKSTEMEAQKRNFLQYIFQKGLSFDIQYMCQMKNSFFKATFIITWPKKSLREENFLRKMLQVT